jgi:hypothetical protein
MDTHTTTSRGPNSLTPLDRIRLPFAFFRFSTQFLIALRAIRNAPNPFVCNTAARSNRHKSRIFSPRFSNIRRTYTEVRRRKLSISRVSDAPVVRCFHPLGPSLRPLPSLATSHSSLATGFLIVNMIIRIHPKSFVFSANSISNRQYSRRSRNLTIRILSRFRIPAVDARPSDWSSVQLEMRPHRRRIEAVVPGVFPCAITG